MIVKQLSSNRRLRHATRYVHLDTRMLFLLLVALPPLIIKADDELNGMEACQNRCFHQFECDEVGNGSCCKWDDNVGQCISSIGHDICPGTGTMSPPPSTPQIACPLTAMHLTEQSHPRILSEIENESTPSTSQTKNDERSCDKNSKKLLDTRYLCHGFSITQVATIIITAKISSVASILGSSYIIRDVLLDPRKRNESIYHRIMLGVSCSDIIVSLSFLLGSWVMPKGELLFAIGSKAACSVVGFVFAFGSSCTPLYGCSLATFYFLKLKLHWVNSKVKAVEKWLLFVPCAVGLIFAISAAAMEKFGPIGLICMSYSINHWYVYILILVLSLGFVSITMFLVFRFVRNVEKTAHSISFAGINSSRTINMNMSRRIMLQGVLYSAVLFSQNILFIFVIILTGIVPVLVTSVTVEMISAIFYPLHGFFNALIYMVPLFKRIMKKRQETLAQSATTTRSSWMAKSAKFMSRALTKSLKQSKKSSKGGQIEIEDECKEEKVLDGNNSKVGLLRPSPHSGDKIDVYDKKEEQQMLHFNASSESNGHGNESEKDNTIGDKSNVVTTSSLMLISCVEDEDEEDIKSFAFPSSEISQSNKKEAHSLCYFSALEANSEICNNVDNEGNESDGDESYVDDYLKMMKD